jgi:uncharacterized repeat protein (TIGR01451 family)
MDAVNTSGDSVSRVYTHTSQGSDVNSPTAFQADTFGLVTRFGILPAAPAPTATPVPLTSTGLVIDKVSSSNPAVQGGTLKYTVRLINVGTPRSGATLTDTLPAGASFLSASPPPGWVCTSQDNQVICSGGTAPTGVSEFTIVVTLTGCQSPLVNTVSVSPATLMLTGSPSTATNTTAELCTADIPTPTPTSATSQTRTLFVSKTAQPNPVAQGDVLTYAIQVVNISSTTSGIVVTDTLPAGVTYLNSSTEVGWSCTQASGVVTCSGGTVPTGVPVSFYIRVQVTDCTTKLNTVTATQGGAVTATASTVTTALCPTPTRTATPTP